MKSAPPEKRAAAVVLVDSSIWLEVEREGYDLGARVPYREIATCPPIVQEVLQGSDTEARYWLNEMTLKATLMLDDPMPLARFEEAAQLYRRCAKAGFQLRSGVDCLIAVCAMAYDVPILARDRDFKHIAKVVPLRLF
jgi:predicted nucleic acid-binding protein